MQEGCTFYQFILQNGGFKICTLPGNSNLPLKLIILTISLPEYIWKGAFGIIDREITGLYGFKYQLIPTHI